MRENLKICLIIFPTHQNGTDMTEAKRPLKVFLCHARADRDPVKALYTRLTNDGVDAFVNGLERRLADKSGLANPRMYNCHKQAKSPFFSVNP